MTSLRPELAPADPTNRSPPPESQFATFICRKVLKHQIDGFLNVANSRKSLKVLRLAEFDKVVRIAESTTSAQIALSPMERAKACILKQFAFSRCLRSAMLS